jgi:hypothetical protein
MTEKSPFSKFVDDAKKSAESVGLIAADAGLKILTPERVQKIDNLKLADRLRGAVDKGADNLRVAVTDTKLKAAQAASDAAKAAAEAKKNKDS